MIVLTPEQDERLGSVVNQVTAWISAHWPEYNPYLHDALHIPVTADWTVFQVGIGIKDRSGRYRKFRFQVQGDSVSYLGEVS